MQIAWVQGLDDTEKEQLQRDLKVAQSAFKRLHRVLAERYDAVERRGFREEDYKNSDWVHLSAFQNGKLSTYKEIAELITLDQQRGEKTP